MYVCLSVCLSSFFSKTMRDRPHKPYIFSKGMV